MRTLIARDLLNISTEDLWNAPYEKFFLQFDDGKVIETDTKETIFSSYAWDIIREFPHTPFLAKHHLREVLGESSYNRGAHVKLFESVAWDVFDASPGMDPDIIARRVYRGVNNLYNGFLIHIEENVGSADILDFIQIINNPGISAANAAALPTEESIAETYRTITTVLKTDPDLQNNALVRAFKFKTIKESQLMQCIGPRGFLTDTDSFNFKYPIMRGFAMGFRSLYDSMIESRSAAKSLLFSKKELQDSEYFSRRLQLMDQIVQRVHQCDCGSTTYLPWHVRGKTVVNGVTTSEGDLANLAGKWYMDDVDGILKVIKASDKHLIGQVLKLRTVLECQHPDPYGVCSRCMGELSLAVYQTNNVGHQCCISMTRKSSQNVLSTKHLDSSATLRKISIDPMHRKWVEPSKDGMSFLLNKGLKGSVTITVARTGANNLNDINTVSRIEDLNIGRISLIENMGFMCKDGTREEAITIPMIEEHRVGSFTYEMLAYIKKYGYNLDDGGNYVIDMKDWDRSLPMVTLPLQQYNMGDHSRDIATLLESRVTDLQKRDKFTSPFALLQEFYDLVNNKLNVNLAILEVILYGVMIVSADENNYMLPKPGGSRGIGVMKRIMAARSLSAAMAYQQHKDAIINPYSFLVKNRPDHPYDAVLCPREVIDGVE